MAFSEKIKKEVREKSNFKCVLCGSNIVEIHHIQSQQENGPDTFENAVALCANCHLLYGGNLLKREEIIQKRDKVYQKLEEDKKELLNLCRMEKAEGRYKVPIDINNIVITVKIKENEDFIVAANKIYKLVYRIQEENPNKLRTLLVEIEGHRNKEGGYDGDMFELQYEFLLKTVFPYLHALHMPLISVENPEEQKKLPSDFLVIADNIEEMEKIRKEYKGKNIELIDLKGREKQCMKN